MDVIFGGDMAWPSPDVLDLDALREWSTGHAFVLNLEGPITPGPAEQCEVEDLYKFNLYSDDSVVDVLRGLGVAACGLANNHICDYRGGLTHTVASLAAAGIRSFGTREQAWCQTEIGGREYVLWGACSALPEPTRLPAGHNQAAQLRPAAALRELALLRRHFPRATLVVFVHWGFELAHYPQPADREWARQAIEAGADYVIGHHPHLVQGLEAHGQGVIAYSLGNFALPQVAYRGRVLRYGSEQVCDQLVLRHTSEGLRSAWLRYDKSGAAIRVGVEHNALRDPVLIALTPFAGLDDAAYRRWFRERGAEATGNGRPAPLTLWSYKGFRGAGTWARLRFLNVRKRARRLAIKAGFHRPYNW